MTSTVTDALTYVTLVKNEFAQQPDVYQAFLTIMKDFKANAIDSNEVARRVTKLFHGHQGLLTGFRAFLPPANY